MKRKYRISVYVKGKNNTKLELDACEVEYNYPEDFFTSIDFASILQVDAQKFMMKHVGVDITRDYDDTTLFICENTKYCDFAAKNDCHIEAAIPHKYGPKCNMFWCGQRQKMIKCVEYIPEKQAIIRDIDNIIEEI